MQTVVPSPYAPGQGRGSYASSYDDEFMWRSVRSIDLGQLDNLDVLYRKINGHQSYFLRWSILQFEELYQFLYQGPLQQI